MAGESGSEAQGGQRGAGVIRRKLTLPAAWIWVPACAGFLAFENGFIIHLIGSNSRGPEVGELPTDRKWARLVRRGPTHRRPPPFPRRQTSQTSRGCELHLVSSCCCDATNEGSPCPQIS